MTWEPCANTECKRAATKNIVIDGEGLNVCSKCYKKLKVYYAKARGNKFESAGRL